MSDLAATNCGGGCSCGNNCGCSIIWIIILLSCFCGNGNSSLFGGNDCDDNNGCMWIILLLLFCGCGNNNRSGICC